MQFTFTIQANVERVEGKFATRDELESQIIEALEGADPGQLDGENGGQYEINDWEVQAEEQPKRQRRRRTQLTSVPATDDGVRLEDLLP